MKLRFFKTAIGTFAVTVLLSGAVMGTYVSAEEIPSEVVSTTAVTVQENETVQLIAPAVLKAENTVDGVRISWNAAEGAAEYEIYRKAGASAWVQIGRSAATTYTDKGAKSGQTYSYSIRCIDATGGFASGNGQAKNIKYIKAPVITKLENTATGTKITWSKSEGASSYAVYLLDSNKSWKKLGETKSTSYTHKKLSSGKTYTYTVRCLDSKKKAVSAYDEDGTSNVFLKAPVISAVKSVESGVRVEWKALKGASAYSVYRKTEGSSWTKAGTSKGASFTDKKAKSGKKYYYAVRCIDKNGKLVSVMSTSKSLKHIKAPVITKFENTSTDTKIKWEKSEGASSYAVYLLDSNKKWKKLGETKSTSYTHKKLSSGKTYTYRVRCLDSKKKAVGGYDKDGTANVFVKAPAVSSVTSVRGGTEIKWNKLKGAASYRIYRKNGSSSWKSIGTSKTGSFTDKNVASGEKYTYRVKCLDKNGKVISVAGTEKSVRYIKAPVIKKFENTASGIKLSWEKSKGASAYAVYLLDSKGKWQKLGDTKSSSYTHKDVKNGKSYTYRIKCLDSKGKAVSGAEKGKSALYTAPQKITKASQTDAGFVIEWKAVKAASGYRVFRRALGSSWEKLADVTSGTSYTDTSAEKNKAYCYGIRCLDKNKKYISVCSEETKYYLGGKLAHGEIKVGGKKYNFNQGVYRSGLQKIDGKTYYFDSDGNIKKNGIVGSDKDGWYYADKNGVINMNYVDGIEYKGKKWIVSNGKAKKVSTQSDKVLYSAAKEVAKVTKPEMSKEKKLKACFDYSQKNYIELRPRTPHYKGLDWPIVYANDMFIRGAGNCFSYAAAFAYMAKAIGYEEVYLCNSGGHGWAEIDGLVYDPEWGRHYKNHTYFGLDYETTKDPNYKNAFKKEVDWMYIKVK